MSNTEQQQITPDQLLHMYEIQSKTVQDLANKLSQKEVENSQLRANYESILAAIKKQQAEEGSAESEVVPPEEVEVLDVNDTEGPVPS